MEPRGTQVPVELRTPHKHPEPVLRASYEPGAFDSHAVDVPFVYRHDGRYWMTFVGFDGRGYRTGLAVSDDLLSWEKRGLLIDRGPAGSTTEHNVALTWIVRDNALYGPGTLKRVDGRYLGTYHAYPRPGYEAGPAAIGLCWSDDLAHWELEEPCIRSSDPDAGAWERGGLYKSCLVEHTGRFHLFYNAKTAEPPHDEQTGLATSDDLKTWRRHPANPLVRNGGPEAFDHRFASDPCVLRLGEQWAMFYYGLAADGHARDGVALSDDLIAWRKAGVTVDVGPPGSIDAQYAHKPSVITRDGRLYHYYCAVAPAQPGETGAIETGEVRGIAVATG
jgi:predicted GH43/DUF377 family glycosyl hydrolase